MKCIGISGTPGTGKTEVARTLSHMLNVFHLDLSSYVISNKLYMYYDEERNSYIIDEERIRQNVIELFREKGSMIVSSHYIEILSKDIFDIVFILRRNPYELIEILTRRGWSYKKIAENIEAELLSICSINAIEEFGEDMIIEIDTSSRNISSIVNEIIEILNGLKTVFRGIRIDWLKLLPEEKLNLILEFIEKHRI